MAITIAMVMVMVMVVVMTVALMTVMVMVMTTMVVMVMVMVMVMVWQINSSPGFQGLERATGVDVASATLAYIKLRLGLWRIPKRRRAPEKLINFEVPIDDAHRS